MHFLVFGGGGQLATELLQLSPNYPQHIFSFKTAQEVDITDASAVMECIKNLQPDVVINAAAYTAVDKAESDTERAYAINAEGVKNIALACNEFDARLLHVSTDFVFSGNAFTPYMPDAEIAPVSVYGDSKAKGEQFVHELMPQTGLVARTSWLYSAHSPCFVSTMLRLMNERDELGIVWDQIGAPTSVTTLAEWLITAAENGLNGTYHVCDAGVASWYDFAHAIYTLGNANGLVSSPCSIKPITTDMYPTPARRPHYSVMNTRASFDREGPLKQKHWADRLEETILKMATPSS